MKVFRNVLIFFFSLAAVSYAAYSFYSYSLDSCQKVTKYAIGRFDGQFGISEQEFRASIEEAERIWEEAIGRETFAYDPEADFKINLIYDERQIATVQKQRTESGLSLAEAVFKNTDSQFRTFKTRYEGEVALYERALEAYEKRKSEYERDVAEWNEKGGAPKETFEDLEAERRYLNAEAGRLNQEVYALREMSGRLSTLLAERNAKAIQYNKAASEYNKKYNQGLEFNQAEYNGQEINIYQFGTKEDLLLALSHEFGHALGLDHVDNPSSVMYYLTGMNAESTPTLSEEDLLELERVCGLK